MKLTVPQLVRKSPAFYGTRSLSWTFTSARYLIVSWARWTKSMFPPQFFRTTLISSSHIQLDIPGGAFPSGFLTETLYAVLVSYICATCSAHLTLLDLITRTIPGGQYKYRSSPMCNLLQSAITSSLSEVTECSPSPYDRTPSAYNAP